MFGSILARCGFRSPARAGGRLGRPTPRTYGAALATLTLLFAAWSGPALAQSAGCAAINSGALDHTVRRVTATVDAVGTTANYFAGQTSVHSIQTQSGGTDPTYGTAPFGPGYSTLPLAAGDRISVTASTTNFASPGDIVGITLQGTTTIFSITGNGTQSTTYTATGNETHFGIRTWREGGSASADISFLVTCTPATPELSVNNVTVNEGNSGLTAFTFTVSLSSPAGPGGVTFDIATANDVGALAGTDYVAQSLTGQVIPAGQSTYTFTVQVNGDTTREDNETFVVRVTNVTGALVFNDIGIGHIMNDDPLPSVTINDVTMSEGTAGATLFTFTVSLSAASSQTVNVNYATANSTATGSDYTGTSGTITFPPNDTVRTVSIVVNGDATDEADETFFLNLSGAVNANIQDNQGVGTILNDDVAAPLVTLTYDQSSILTGEGVVLTGTLTNPNAVTTLTGLTTAIDVDTFDIGAVVNNFSTDCGVALQAVGDTLLLQSVPSLGAGGSCTFTAAVTPNAAGTLSASGSAPIATGPVSVTGVAPSAANVTVSTPPPAVVSVSPAVGQADRTSPGVVITGTNFTGATSVTFGGVSASFVVDSDTQITATAPSVGESSVVVRVTTPSGSSGSTAGASFSYILPPSVSLTYAEASIVNGSTASLTVTLSNPNVSFGLTGLTTFVDVDGNDALFAFVDSATSDCGASLQFVGDTLQIDVPSLGPVASCNVFATVNVPLSGTLNTTGSQPVATGPTNLAGLAPTAASLSVTGLPPLAPTIQSPTSGTATTDATPNISGNAEANVDVQVFVDGNPADTTTSNGVGFWSVDLTSPLSDGPHTITARATYPSNMLTSDESAPVTLTVDTTGPADPVLTSPANGSTIGPRPTFTGTAEPGTTVNLVVASVVAGTATADGAGNWSLTPDSDLAGGALSALFTAADSLGNVSPGAAASFTVAAAPVVTGLSPSGGSAAGGLTVQLTGTGLTGATAVTFGGVPATSFVVVSDTLLRAVTPPNVVGIADVVVTTPLGDSSASGTTFNYVPPGGLIAAPTISAPAQGAALSDATPRIEGSIPNSGQTLTILLDGALIDTVVTGGDGSFVYEFASPLSDGAYTVEVVRENSGFANSTTVSFTVDTTPPAAPIIDAPADGSTVGPNVTVTGTAEPNATLTIELNSNPFGTTQVDGSGNFSFDLVGLPQGTNTVFLQPTDAAGNQGFFAGVTFTVAEPPAVPVITSTPPLFSTSQVASFTFTVDAGATAECRFDSDPFITCNSPVVSSNLAQGPHTFEVRAVNGAGAASASASYSFTVDSVPPLTPVIVSPADGSTVSTPTPTLSGTGEPGVTLEIYNGAQLLGSTVVDGSGTWSVPLAVALPFGTSSIGALSTDAAGNTSISLPYIITVSQVSITTGSLPAGTAGVAYNQTVTVGNGVGPYSLAVTAGVLPPGLTLDGTTGAVTGVPTQAGTFDFTVTVTDQSTGASDVQDFSVTVAGPILTLDPAALPAAVRGQAYNQALSASGGTAPYSYAVSGGTLPPGLMLMSSLGVIQGTPTIAGDYDFTVTVTDSTAGPGQPFSASRNYSLSVGASVPVVDTPTPNQVLAGGLVTITGTAEPNAQLTLQLGGAASISVPATAGPDGRFQASASGLANGAYTLTVSDVTNGVTAPVVNFSVAVSIAPQLDDPAPGAILDSRSLTARGTGQPGASLTVRLTNAATATIDDETTVIADASGDWSADLTASSDGAYQVSVTDFQTQDTAAITIDTAAPEAPTLGGVTNGASLDDPTPTFTGTAEPGSTVALIIGGQTVALATADGSGTFSLTPRSDLAPGSYSATVVATDAAGNVSVASSAISFNIVALSLTPTLPAAQVAVPYDQTVQATGGTGPYGYAVTAGGLPVGLTLEAATGRITGTPTAGGTFAFTITATDTATSLTVDQAYSLQVDAASLTLSPASLAAATRGLAYSQSVTATGGTAPYSYTVSAGALPDGLSLNATTGEISGTPTTTGTFAFTVAATDSSTGSGPFSVERAYSVTVGAATLTVTPTTLAAVNQGTAYDVTFQSSGGTGPYTYAVTAGALPQGLTLSTAGRLSGTAAQSGIFTFTVTATDDFGNTGAVALSLEVESRPDPTADPDVRGLNNAQAEAVRRLAGTQTINFTRRLESLRDGRADGDFGVDVRGGISDRPLEVMSGVPFELGGAARLGDRDRDAALDDELMGLGRSFDLGGLDAAAGRDEAAGAGAGPSRYRVWAAGAITLGRRDEADGQAELSLSTQGISVGLDTAVSDRLDVGVGLGYGREETDIGNSGSRMEADSWVVAAYASYRPSPQTFLDGVIGYGDLAFDLRRRASDGTLLAGSRDGTALFWSVGGGYDRRGPNHVFTGYGRLEGLSGELDAYTETGSAFWALAYAQRDVDSLQSVLGARWRWTRTDGDDSITPSLRLEWRHEFESGGDQLIRYSDWAGSPDYRLAGDAWDSDEVLVGVGLEGRRGAWSWTSEADARLSENAESLTLRFGLDRSF